MKNISLIIVILVLELLQSCGNKFIYNPVNDVFLNRKLILEVITKELKIDANTVEINTYLNSLDRNNDILEYLKQINSSQNSNLNCIVTLTDVSTSNFELGDNTSICMSTSLPIIEISQNRLYFLVTTSHYYAKNWIGQNECLFIFKRLKKGKLEYLRHLKNLKQINVGPPTYLPNLNDIDTFALKNKMIKVDSIVKGNVRNIQDSIKSKMGINKQ